MARKSAVAAVLLFAGACVPAEQQLVRHHTEDGFQLYRQGSYADARDCFQAALNLKPNDPDLTYNLARCHARLGQSGKAEALYQECLVHNADHAEARHAWLLLMLQTGREAEGRRMVEEWLRARPRQAAPYVEDGWLKGRAGDIDSARLRYQQALGLDPRNPRALAELGAIYERMGHPERALVLYDRSLEAKPDQPDLAQLVSRMRSKGVPPPRPD